MMKMKKEKKKQKREESSKLNENCRNEIIIRNKEKKKKTKIRKDLQNVINLAKGKSNLKKRYNERLEDEEQVKQ